MNDVAAQGEQPPSKARKIVRRCVGGAVAISILATIVTVDSRSEHPWIAVALATLLGVVGAFELFRMLEAKGIAVRRKTSTLAAVALLAAKIAIAIGALGPEWVSYVFGGWFLLAFAREVIAGDAGSGIERVAYGGFGLGYVWLYSFLLDLLLVPAAPLGVHLGLWLVFVSKSNDIGGFLVGNWLGGPKLAPRVSPGKTRSGSLGGVALSLVATFVGAKWIGVDLAASELIAFSILVSVATQFGDLAESLLKRACDVKDSGGLLPTFGGSLDVIDSLAFAAPVGYAFLRATGALS